MNNLEVKKTKLELMRVQTARMELEYKIEESLDQVERLRTHIKIQEAREIELLKQLEGIKS